MFELMSRMFPRFNFRVPKSRNILRAAFGDWPDGAEVLLVHRVRLERRASHHLAHRLVKRVRL